MVSSISSTNVLTQINNDKNQENVTQLIKYLNNEALQEKPDTFVKAAGGAVGSAAVFNGIPLLGFLKNTKFNHGKLVSSSMNVIGEVNQNALKNIFKGEGKLLTRIGDFAKTAKKTNVAFTDLKSAEKALAKSDKVIKKIAEKTGAGKKVSKHLLSKSDKLVEKAIESAEKASTSRGAALVKEATVKNAGKLGKFGKMLKSSGASFMLVFSGIIECATEVIPTFKELGVKKGIKQLGKSAVKVIGDTVGFVGGEYAGISIGTAIGTAICPGIGSAVGAICGFVGGMLGSFVMGKLTKKITGKSEREIAKEQQSAQQASEIANNDEYLKELKSEVINKIQQEAEMNNGMLSEDSQMAAEILQSMESQNPFTVAA